MNIVNHLRQYSVQYVGICIALCFYYFGWVYNNSVLKDLYFATIFFIAVFFPLQKEAKRMSSKIRWAILIVSGYLGLQILITSILDGAFLSMLPLLLFMICALIVKYYIDRSQIK